MEPIQYFVYILRVENIEITKIKYITSKLATYSFKMCISLIFMLITRIVETIFWLLFQCSMIVMESTLTLKTYFTFSLDFRSVKKNSTYQHKVNTFLPTYFATNKHVDA